MSSFWRHLYWYCQVNLNWFVFVSWMVLCWHEAGANIFLALFWTEQRYVGTRNSICLSWKLEFRLRLKVTVWSTASRRWRTIWKCAAVRGHAWLLTGWRSEDSDFLCCLVLWFLPSLPSCPHIAAALKQERSLLSSTRVTLICDPFSFSLYSKFKYSNYQILTSFLVAILFNLLYDLNITGNTNCTHVGWNKWSDGCEEKVFLSKMEGEVPFGE